MCLKQSITILIISFAAMNASASEDCHETSFFGKLSRLNGRRELGNCQIEIHVCEKRDSASALPGYLSEGPSEKSQFWLGDIYVKEAGGKSLYLPLFSPRSRFPRTRVELTETDEKITYLYQDKIFDPKSGQKEKYELIFYKRRPRIELKMKNSRESRRNPIRSLFYPNLFIQCEE